MRQRAATSGPSGTPQCLRAAVMLAYNIYNTCRGASNVILSSKLTPQRLESNHKSARAMSLTRPACGGGITTFVANAASAGLNAAMSVRTEDALNASA